MGPRRGERELPVYARVLALMDQLLSPENAIFKQRELALYFILGPLNIPEITMNCLKLPFNHIPRTFFPKFESGFPEDRWLEARRPRDGMLSLPEDPRDDNIGVEEANAPRL